MSVASTAVVLLGVRGENSSSCRAWLSTSRIHGPPNRDTRRPNAPECGGFNGRYTSCTDAPDGSDDVDAGEVLLVGVRFEQRRVYHGLLAGTGSIERVAGGCYPRAQGEYLIRIERPVLDADVVCERPPPGFPETDTTVRARKGVVNCGRVARPP